MWTIKPFEQVTTDELFKFLKARVDVFVVEQECPYPEIDDLDLLAIHLFKTDSDGQIMAYCRLIETDKEIKLGRVLVSQEHRKDGLGRELVAKALEFCAETYPSKPVYAQAQAYLENFYGSFGFIATSDVYLEDDIPHIDMIKKD